MEKIYYDDNTHIWKTKLNFTEHKKYLIEIANDLIKYKIKGQKYDGYTYKNEFKDHNFTGDLIIENKFDEILQKGIDICKKLYKETNVPYNKVNYDSWLNVVRSKKPRQENFKDGKLIEDSMYHTHTDINEKRKIYTPHYTLVYYIQMPNVLENEDGVLYFKGDNNKEYFILPEEDDLIIMPGNMPHVPNNAPKSKINRIVLALNVGFEYLKIKKSII